jgi:hypothetical protein
MTEREQGRLQFAGVDPDVRLHVMRSLVHGVLLW